MGSCAKWGNTIIVTINSFFGLIGLLCLVGGFFVKFKPDLLDKVGKKAMDKIAEHLPDKDTTGIDLKDLKLSDLVGDAATPMLILGVALLAVVMWAYLGTCCKSKWMLIVYAAILTAVVLGEVALAILLLSKREKVDEAIKKPLKQSLTKFYTGEKGKDLLTLGWNALMGLLHCCGVEGAEDFANTTLWNRTYEYPNTITGVTVKMKVQAPLLCCKEKDNACSDVNALDHSYNQGCYAAIWDLMKKQRAVAIGVACGIGVLEIVLWLSVVAIIRDLAKKNKVAPE